MTTYMLILLATQRQMDATRTPAEARESQAKWQAWHADLEAAGRLAGGLQVTPERRRVSSAGVDDLSATPDDALVIGGYFLVKAESLEEATELAQQCPLVAAGGQVEVRPAIPGA